MSGVYTAVFGESQHADTLLGMLGVQRRQFERYRDCFKIDQPWTRGPKIAVYTRLGGNNRREYVQVIAFMRRHLMYWSDRDDAYDNTYMTFLFHPPKVSARFDAIPAEEPRDDLWRKKIRELQAGLIPGEEMERITRRVSQETVVYTGQGTTTLDAFFRSLDSKRRGGPDAC